MLLVSVVRKTSPTLSKTFRSRAGRSLSFLLVSSCFHSQLQLVLRLCSWFQNGHHLGFRLTGFYSVGERKGKRDREKGERREREDMCSSQMDSEFLPSELSQLSRGA